MDNTVSYLQSINFSSLPLNEKLCIKIKGKPTPNLNIQQISTSRSKEYSRQFNNSVYEKCDWLCGCDKLNAFFCFPCLLYGGDYAWTKSGVTDLKHLQLKIRKHEMSTKHMSNMIDLALLGKVNIATRIDTTYMNTFAKHNEQVKHNRYVLSKIISCVRFCGNFELPLVEHNETASSKNPGVFRGLLDFACELDSSLEAYLNTSIVFKDHCSTIQNELLDSMLNICQEKIKDEINNAEYLAVMCDEITDVFDKSYMVIVLRYEIQGKPVERFWGFFNLFTHTAEAFASVLLNELQILIGKSPDKLIAQTYDGAAALASKGVQTRIKEVYNNAHFIHCYAHQANLIVEKATSQNTCVRIFFSSLSEIPAFFLGSPKRMAALDNVCIHKIPNPPGTHRNFSRRTVDLNYIHEMKLALIECCNTLETSNSRETGCASAGIKRTLNDPEFEFWLEFFSKVMPPLDTLFSQFQSRNIDTIKANVSLDMFNSTIQNIRDGCEDDQFWEEEPQPKRRRHSEDKVAAIKEVCEMIMVQCNERLSFTDHLEASNLVLVDNFSMYANNFPSNELTQAVEAYPMLDQDRLKTELRVLYGREDLCKSGNLLDFLEVMNESRLQSTFSETVKLIKILITTPMTTTEEGRCFSTLKRIKTFLGNTMVRERLTALGMIAIENKMITEMKDFSEKTIDHFATSKGPRMDFIFK